MDQEALVDRAVRDGNTLLTALAGRGFDVTTAGWVKAVGDGRPYLYIVSPAAAGGGKWDAYGEIQTAFRSLGPTGIRLTDVKLIDPADPLAGAMLGEGRRFPGSLPIRHSDAVLGSVYVEEAYLYPPSLFAPQPQPS